MKEIIVSDCDQSFLQYVEIFLKRMGYNVIPAQNGNEVIKLLQTRRPGAVIIDVGKETKDGMMTFTNIKKDEKTSPIPVITISDESIPDTIEQCKNLGCAGHLIKPVKVDDLHEIIECIFSQGRIKRKRLRACVRTKVIVIHDGREQALYTENICENGIYISKADPLPSGSEVEITLLLEKQCFLKLKGVVVFVREIFDDKYNIPPGMGIQFKDVSDDQVRTLKNYIERLFAEDIFRETFPKYR
jgi:CheY-like chemotaxis protein